MLLNSIQTISKSAPGRVAIVSDGEQLTYGQVEVLSVRLARLLAGQGVARGSLVAIYAKRTARAVLWMLAAMRCGAAYTVVEDDGHHEENRNRLRLVRPSLVLCDEGHLEALRRDGLQALAPGAEALPVPDAEWPLPAPEDTAYVLFTSGSTGVPKGVAVTHANIAHYTSAVIDRLRVSPGLRYAHVSTLAADLGNTSLFLALWTGGCLHVVDSETRRDPAALRHYLVANAISFLKITPTHWSALFSAGDEAASDGLRLEYLLLGGEPFSVGLAKKILESGAVKHLVNHYGPTETTVGVTVYPIESAQQLSALTGDSIPIGRPLGSTTLVLRREDGALLERGASGELYIGGPSVSRGYVGDAAATSRSFVELEGRPGGKFYKTGDLVTIDDAGVVRFLGRVDRQIKVNGYRVELEHVESVLRTVPGVESAAVFFPEVRGKKRLVAAIRRAPERAASLEWLRERLESLIPEYMIPSTFVDMGEFPRNDNGKIDFKALEAQVVARLQGADRPLPERPAPAATGVDSAVRDEVRSLWRRYIQADTFGDDDDFFSLGGDSVDAIQFIAELQFRGLRLTARGFHARPTLRGVLASLGESARPSAGGPKAEPAPTSSRALSAAQDFFFRQRFAQPDHYNQALLLECERAVDVDALWLALAEVMTVHPSLRAEYAKDERGVVVRLTEPRREGTLTASALVGEDEIERTAQRIQESIALAGGRLFRAHVFRAPDGRDLLLLVAHHIAVDLVSWRIVVSDLVHAYIESAAGRAPSLPRGRTSFFDWAAHIESSADALLASSAEWLARAQQALAASAAPYDERNTEAAARTAWLRFSSRETQALRGGAAGAGPAPLHVLLLAAFARCLGRARGLTTVPVDVESHGRIALDDEVDVSRVVGWHTSTFPVFVGVAARGLAEVAGAVGSTLRELPSLGAAFGVAAKSAPAGARGDVAPVCFNYLGDLELPHDARFAVRPASRSIGRARGDRNNRLYELKMTARVSDGALLVDLSFPGSTAAESMVALLNDVRRTMLAAVGLDPEPTDVVVEAGTRTGNLTYAPRADEARAALVARDYAGVLFTGATGYVGVHVLRELLSRSSARVHCVVRGKPGQSAAERLRRCYDGYFPEEKLATWGGRVSVLEGDVAARDFGLPAREVEGLCDTLDAIYHFAADTRLFGPEQDFLDQNVGPAKTCVAWATRGKPKDMHHMSTLAVCGVNPRPGEVEFSEESFDIGQEFQNEYERTKYLAEGVVKELQRAGGRAFIYRSGNVSGHSRTGRFQMNASANRFVQFLVACVKAGELPRAIGGPIALSPVDEVAAGIVGISLSPSIAGGVFHVDTTHEVGMDKVFGALARSGVELRASHHASFESLFRSLGDRRDPDLALGAFWAARRSRNVRYDHRRTHRVLERIGRAFRPLGDEWVFKFVSTLALTGIFASSVFGPDFAPSRHDAPREARP